MTPLTFQTTKTMNRIKRIVSNVRLCLRYPFLYYVSDKTGCHYNNWPLFYRIENIGLRIKSGKIGFAEKVILGVKRAFMLLYYKSILQMFHFLPCRTMFDSIPFGWRTRFGIEFCDDLKKAILDRGGKRLLGKVKIAEIGEKFGVLDVRFSVRKMDDSIKFLGSGVLDVIIAYTKRSSEVCIGCGCDATGRSIDWIRPLCDSCAIERGYSESKKNFMRFV